MTPSNRWTTEQAWEWYRGLSWPVGCNFIPSSAINQLEMWQTETFDPETIDRELGWAASLGFNTVRVYLHDLLWDNDAHGFTSRIDHFLTLASHHNIRPILVLFDDCWNSEFSLGPQPEPRQSVHNSGWLQSPGINGVNHPQKWDRLERYVTAILSTFKQDQRILMWDLYNEPGNSNQGRKSMPLLKAVFDWAWSIRPAQPLSAGIWFEDPSFFDLQIHSSDVITFHNYENTTSLEKQIAQLKIFGRPMICTEYMSRPLGSRFETHLPIFKRAGVGCINWGLVAGKTNTIYGWNTPQGAPEPEIWFHDIFYPDGRPYREEETSFIRQQTR